MKKYLVSMLILVALLMAPLAALASDITGADYRTVITVINSGTAATQVWVPFTLSTSDMITGGMLSANATDAVIQSSGVDMAFMPGVGANPWITQVVTIGAASQQTQNLYTKGVTGGKIRFFPDTGGMTVTDHASLEIGSSGNITVSGYLDTTAGASKYIVRKNNALQLFVDPSTSGNVTVSTTNYFQVAWNDSWIICTGTRSRVGEKITSYPAITIPSVSFLLLKESTPTGTAFARLYKVSDGSLLGTFGSIDVSTLTTTATWYTFSTPVDNPSVQDVYIVIEYAGDGDPAHRVRVVAQNSDVVSDAVLAKFTSPNWTTDATWDTALKDGARTSIAGVASGEKTLSVSISGGNLTLAITGATSASTALSGIPGSGSNWVFFQNNVMPYVESASIDVGGVPVSAWEWEYDTTFHDSIGSNDATPTFRTTSSDADVSAEITSQEGLLSTATPVSPVSGGWTLLETVPETPEDLFSEGGDGYPGGSLITAWAIKARVPITAAHFIWVYALVLFAIFGVYAVTAGRKGSARYIGSFNGSLLIAFATGLLVQIFFYRAEAIPGLGLILYGLSCMAILFWSRSPSPVD